MSAPRKPIFGFLWPAPDPDAPVDESYRQIRGVRVSPRGPIRIAALILSTLLTATALGAMLMAALTAPLTASTFVASAAIALALVAVLRGWVVGTYVHDDGVVVETVLRRTRTPWTEVDRVSARLARCPALGTPLPVRGQRVFVECADGRSIATHVYTTSPDFWLRPEAFDMARLRLVRWNPDQG